VGWSSYELAHAGAAAITGNNAFHADYPKDFLIDDRAGSLCKFNAAATDHYIQIDRGSGTLEEIARLIIPVGHNFNGENIRVQTDSDPGFGVDPTEILPKAAVSSAGIIDLAMTGGTEAQRKYRYVRIDDDDAASWNPEIPELILTRTRTTTRGPEQGWTDYYQHNTLHFEKESGSIASLALGADRRYFEFTYRNVSDTADLLVFSDLIDTCGTSKPFYMDPPFTDETVIWVKLTEDSRQIQDPAVPASTDSTQRQIELAMLEHLA
jgi:hypothetical protein